MITLIWAICATVVAIALFILHFAHPYPLVQIPDKGHRLYVAPSGQHDIAVKLLKLSGMRVFGTFTAGVRQTLFRDGYTVIASGEQMQKAALSIPVNEPKAAAEQSRDWLDTNQIYSYVTFPLEGKEATKIAVLHIPTFGWDIAYRLTGKKMPWPVWEK